MFKYWFGIKTTLLESLRSRLTHLRALLIRLWSTICQPIRHQDSSYFGLEFLGVFRVVYYVILSYFCLSMNLESFGTFSGSIGIYYQFECQEVRELADRSRHSSRPIGPSDAIWQKLRRSDAHSAKRSRAGNKFGIGSADRSSLVADRSPSLLINHLTAPIDRQACRSVA